MTIFALYQYTHKESGKKYIGVTKNLSRRGKDHAKGQSGVRVFNRAVKKYGIEAFEFRVLAIFDRVEAVRYHEHAAILKFGTLAPRGYNSTAGAVGTSYCGPYSEETRRKHSLAVMGHPVSEETRRKISEATTGHHIPSAETRKKLSKAGMGNQNGLGYKHSDEARAKISKALVGNQRALGSHSRLGQPHTDATKKKMSESRNRWLANQG